MPNVNMNVHPVDAISLSVGKPNPGKFETLKIEFKSDGSVMLRVTGFFYAASRERLIAAAEAFNRTIQES